VLLLTPKVQGSSSSRFFSVRYIQYRPPLDPSLAGGLLWGWHSLAGSSSPDKKAVHRASPSLRSPGTEQGSLFLQRRGGEKEEEHKEKRRRRVEEETAEEEEEGRRNICHMP